MKYLKFMGMSVLWAMWYSFIMAFSVLMFGLLAFVGGIYAAATAACDSCAECSDVLRRQYNELVNQCMIEYNRHIDINYRDEREYMDYMRKKKEKKDG